MSKEERSGTCPFCGSINIRLGKNNKIYFQVVCKDCKARGPAKMTYSEAISAWNGVYLGNDETSKEIESEQLKRVISGEIAVQCNSQFEFNTLVNSLNKVGITCSISKNWHLWSINSERTCVSVGERKFFKYCTKSWYLKNRYTVENIKLKEV